MEFTEDITLEIPNIEEQINLFSESSFGGDSKGLIIEVAAIHEGLTSNFRFYPGQALEDSLESWVSPYPKPIIMNHDPLSEPVGRVMAAKMDHEADGTPFARLQVAITDPKAARKILDQRYLTGSVGGKALEARCNICSADWSEASAFNLPCKHQRGKAYKGQVAYIEMKNLSFKEYSFVNMPADQRSGIRTKVDVASEGGDNDNSWIRPARIFSLNMDKEEVLEYTESESRDVLSGLRRKEAAPLYLSLKGAFLSALAANENDKTEDIQEEEEDILSISEELSQDLAQTEDVVEADEKAADSHSHPHMHEDGSHDHSHNHEGDHTAFSHDLTSTPTPHGHDHSEGDPERVPEVAEDPDADATTAAASDDAGVDVTEAKGTLDDPRINTKSTKKAEGQARPRGTDIDPETSTGAPRNRTHHSDAPAEVVEEDSVETDVTVVTELEDKISSLELRVQEMTELSTTLGEENAKLKTALKRNLAERVVDSKVMLGLVTKEGREEQLEDHMSRSATSLADSLRDLSTMKAVGRQVNYDEFPTTESVSLGVQDKHEEGRVLTVVEEESAVVKPNPEDVFVDALMGRRKL